MTLRPTLPPTATPSRREFMRASWLVAGGAVVGGLSLARSAHAFGSDEIRIGLIGCGRRGTKAAVQALNTATSEQGEVRGGVKLVAMADVFEDRLQASYRTLRGHHDGRVAVPRDRQFCGLDAFRRVLETEADLVILATPPGFRPLHFEAAVQAGKHVFLEKPLATDSPGVRRILAANTEAQAKGLAVAVGLQRRHEQRYRETVRQLQDGAIGEINLARVCGNSHGAGPPRQHVGWTDLEQQLRNWQYHTWLSGDYLVEQHIHHLDVSNWLLQGPPVECHGPGGRPMRPDEEHKPVVAHPLVEYTYPNGAKLFSQYHPIPGAWTALGEFAHGTRGTADISGARIMDEQGRLVWKLGLKGTDGQQQHSDLLAALRRGERPNEVEYAAASTLTAIMGRMAMSAGRAVRWEEAFHSPLSLADVDGLHSLDDASPTGNAVKHFDAGESAVDHCSRSRETSGHGTEGPNSHEFGYQDA